MDRPRPIRQKATPTAASLIEQISVLSNDATGAVAAGRGMQPAPFLDENAFPPSLSRGATGRAQGPLLQAEPDAASQEATRTARWLLSQANALHTSGRIADALATLRRAVAVTPADASLWYNLGIVAAKAHSADEAAAAQRRAIDLKPDFGLAQYQLGIMLYGMGLTADAIAAFRESIRLRTRVRESQARLGELLHMAADLPGAVAAYRAAANRTSWGRVQEAKAFAIEERFSEAEAACRKALALDRSNAGAHWVLGNALAAQGRFDQAIEHYDHAISLRPDNPLAYCARTSVRPVTAGDRPVLDRMRALLDGGSLTPSGRMSVEYALGKAFDDLGDYETAFRHFDAAHRIQRPMVPYDRRQMTAWVDLLIERYTPAYFERHAAWGVADETPLLILGMPRSGTTLVEQILTSHSRIAGGGELDFWSRCGPSWEQAGPSANAAAALGGDYQAVLRRLGPGAARVTDKMPHNFMWIGLIHTIFPRARIIHCRRHPVDTCVSIYMTPFTAPLRFAQDRGDLVHEYREYQRLMAHWRAVLPASLFLDIDYEAVVGDTAAQARRLVEFCGLGWEDACLRPEHNVRAVNTASVWQARQPVYRASVERWRRYAPWLGELASLLPPGSG